MPSNQERAETIRNILPDFKSFAGLVGEPDADVIGDLLCNIAHFCDREDITFGLALIRAQGNYQEETNGKGCQFEEVILRPSDIEIGEDDDSDDIRPGYAGPGNCASE